MECLVGPQIPLQPLFSVETFFVKSVWKAGVRRFQYVYWMRIAIAVRDGSKPAKFDYCKFLVKPTVPASKWVHSCKRQKSLPAKPPTVVEPLFYSIVTVLPTWNIIWHLSQIYTFHNWTRIYSTFATLESSRFFPLYFTFCNKSIQSSANLKK